MSLESINQKLRMIEKRGSSWKFLLYVGILPALFSVAIVPLINPLVLAQYPNAIVKVVIISVLTLGFISIYLVLAGGAIISGIMITWFLIKCRNEYYKLNGGIVGKSLSTNHDFLRNLAEGLWKHLVSLIKAFYDPKFEELELRHSRERDEDRAEINSLKQEIQQLKADRKYDYDLIAEQKRTIFEQGMLIRSQKKVIDKLLPEQAKKETQEKDSQIISKDNRFEAK